MAEVTNLRSSKAPNLPIAPVEYGQRYQDQFLNVLRLYFNTIDSIFGALLGPLGGKYLNIPHIAASDSTDQYADGDDTPTVVKWNTLDSGAGFVLEAPGSAYPEQTGIYKITYSLQFANTDNSVEHDVVVWLRIDGEDVENSATYFTTPKAKSAGVPNFSCGYSEVVFTITTNSVVELVWATDTAATSGGTNGVYIFADPAQVSPYERPAIPSSLGSITFVSSTGA